MKSLLTSLLLLIIVTFIASFNAQAQQSLEAIEQQLSVLDEALTSVKKQEDSLLNIIEDAKLQRIQYQLVDKALPKLLDGEEVIAHSAMSLVYSEEHEQPKWVAHIITPDVLNSNLGRSNDFREDPKVKTGSSVEADYFLKELQADSSYTYDGYGFDRGHLAPSADFRWSQKAVSESYFYSNMSPQRPEFNRESWASLENLLRGYLYRNPKTQLYVVTGPVLQDDLPKVERSVNKVSIPELFFKVVLDLNYQKGIAFLMPNKAAKYPLTSYVASIDKIEELTGIDFFPKLEDPLETNVEAQNNIKDWVSDKEKDNVEPLYPPSLPKNTFNTVQAKLHAQTGKTVNICGTIISARKTSKGNIMLKMDQHDPSLFIVFIREKNIPNFSYDPIEALLGTTVCIKGKVKKLGKTPMMFIDNEKAVQLYEED